MQICSVQKFLGGNKMSKPRLRNLLTETKGNISRILTNKTWSQELIRAKIDNACKRHNERREYYDHAPTIVKAIIDDSLSHVTLTLNIAEEKYIKIRVNSGRKHNERND